MQWWYVYAGWDLRHRKMEEPEKDLFGNINSKDDRRAFCIGAEYTLPMLVKAGVRLDTEGKLRFQAEREDVPLSKRLRFNFMVNTDKEYMAGLRYAVTKYLSLSTHYDSDMGFGAGITFTY
jgi:hypothetical protein